MSIDQVNTEYEQAKGEWIYDHSEQKSKAGTYLMRDPDFSSTLFGLLDNTPGDAMGEAAVRDGANSIEVLVLVKSQDGYHLSPLPWVEWQADGVALDRHLPIYQVPDARRARLVARQSLRLPSRFSFAYKVMEETIKALEENGNIVESWQSSSWLKGQLFLLLEETALGYETMLGGHRLVYRKGLGLMVMDQ